MGTDFAASLSASGSATSGIDLAGAFQHAFGDDFIVGGKKPSPDWLPAVVIAAIAAVVLVYFLRR